MERRLKPRKTETTKSKTMKHPKTTTAIGVIAIGLLAFALQTQQGVSQSGPSTQSSSFNSHYSEVDFPLPAGSTSPTITLPKLDRSVRMAFSYNRDDGYFASDDLRIYYRTTLGTMFLGDFPMPEGNSYNIGGLLLTPGPNGSFVLTTDASTNGTVHIAFWY